MKLGILISLVGMMMLAGCNTCTSVDDGVESNTCDPYYDEPHQLSASEVRLIKRAANGRR